MGLKRAAQENAAGDRLCGIGFGNTPCPGQKIRNTPGENRWPESGNLIRQRLW
jgi:hypothetical protein